MPKEKKNGRPSIWSEALEDEICRRIAAGRSVLSVSKDDDMPSDFTIWKWMNERESFSLKYARAIEARAMAHADEISDLSRRVVLGEVPPDVARVAPAVRVYVAVTGAQRRLASGVGERHPCSPWAMLQVLLLEWCQECCCDVLAHNPSSFLNRKTRAPGTSRVAASMIFGSTFVATSFQSVLSDDLLAFHDACHPLPTIPAFSPIASFSEMARFCNSSSSNLDSYCFSEYSAATRSMPSVAFAYSSLACGTT